MTKFNRGFTLIELLVVIAVIGVMSAIVLGQLNSARLKGNDAASRAAFKNLAPQSAIYYDQFENYSSFCPDSKAQSIYQAVGAVCNGGFAGFRVLVPLKQCNVFGPSSGCDDYLCTDANGNVKVLDTNPGGATLTCP